MQDIKIILVTKVIDSCSHLPFDDQNNG
jgi:hypothetical protein